MSETPHCSAGKDLATCCNSVKFCYLNTDFSKQFLRLGAMEVTEYKRLDRGWNRIGGFPRKTALKMQGIGPSCTVDEGPCIK
jgi:hypothetical protein